MLFVLSADFFPEKIFQEYHLSVKQIGARSGLTICLIWVQTVCKGYQQMTLGGKELKVVFADLSLADLDSLQ